eukprot:1001598-Prymnesium_polylepis.1
MKSHRIWPAQGAARAPCPNPMSFRKVSPCRMAQGRSVSKKKFVFSSNAVCSPEPWSFERRVTHHATSPRLWARMCVNGQGAALLRDAHREDHRRRSVNRDGPFIDVELQLIRRR